MTDSSRAAGAADPASARPGARGRLHQPRRWLVALVEVLLAALCVWGAFALWDSGIVAVATELEDGTRLTSTRYLGNRIGSAIALGTLASVLVLDALRQVVLAVRVRRDDPGTDAAAGGRLVDDADEA